MTERTSAEIRQSFLDYFAEHDHAIVASSPLVPADDPTLLFTNAGMNQFKDLFLGRERRAYQRATTSQKCMRVSGKHNDLNNVGPSLRHHTFFEMLGNFSFGDYFKTEAIPFAWELLTGVWRIPPDRLYATIFKGEDGIPRDDDAYDTWRRLVAPDRIVELGSAENFWAMGDTGPCGRCSEVHYHRGDHLPCSAPTCRGIDCDCDRYVEVWNNVFMEFERRDDGTLTDLPAPSIDTGMGLERIVAVMQGTLSNYDTDLFTPILAAIGESVGRRYGAGDTDADRVADTSMRVVADHLRAMTFLIGDGVTPSNEWRGYVLRKIMRRAMRHGKKLGLSRPFLHQLTGVVVEHMGDAYPDLRTSRDTIAEVTLREEDQFDTVLTKGLHHLEDALQRAQASGSVSGADAFRLYDSHGLPLDFIDDLAEERGLGVDRETFDRLLEAQRAKSRQFRTFDTSAAVDYAFATDAAKAAALDRGDDFTGYATTTAQAAEIVALFDDERQAVDVLPAGATGSVVLSSTPFYVEAGGQVSDEGRLAGPEGEATVVGMSRLGPGAPRVHAVQVDHGELRQGGRVTAEVDAERRAAIRRNHTATHLLHAALRTVLGPHVAQKGSLVAPDRLRFDFSHVEAISAECLREIETRVNRQTYANHPVETDIRSHDEAVAAGAMALFGEKYGDEVRVVTVPGVSMELCGGTHCAATGDIGPFVITHESGVAAGVRRIEALTGDGALAHVTAQRAALDGVLSRLAVSPDEAVDAVGRLQAETKRLGRELEQLRVQAAAGNVAADDEAPVEVAGVPVLTRRVHDLAKGELRGLSDTLRDRLGSGVVVLSSEQDGRVGVLVSVTKDLTDRIHAGRVVKAVAPLIGARGGGRPELAEAGGGAPDNVDRLFDEARAVVGRMLSGEAAPAGSA